MAKTHLLYLTLGAIILISSCSQEEIAGDKSGIGDDNRIVFRATLPELTTRVADVTVLESFQVTGFTNNNSSLSPYFIDIKYVKSGESADSKFFPSTDQSDPCRWPANNTRLDFIAFAPSTQDMRVADDDFKLSPLKEGETLASPLNYSLNNFKINPHIDRQFDFVTAIANGNLRDNDEQGIKLSFNHQLSRITLSAWGSHKTCNIEIAGVRIGQVGTGSTFNFSLAPDGSGGFWDANSLTKGNVEYIFGEGDEIISLNNRDKHHNTEDTKVSIMGNGGAAMVIPANYTGWDYSGNKSNDNAGLYFSVLVRVTDANTTSQTQVYPNTTNSGTLPIVYLAVSTDNGVTEVTKRLYKNGDKYYPTEDFASGTEYTPQPSEVIKEFAWAALPAATTNEWKAGYKYDYVLNYTEGIGIHDPSDSPTPGEPIIGDKVGISVSVNDWKTMEDKVEDKVEVPES